MATETELFVPKKSTTGFKLSPNPEVQDLENALGIKFSVPPVRIDLTFQNRLVYRMKRGFRGLFDPLLPRGTIGSYFRDFHAYVVRPEESNRVDSWHENMHGYLNINGFDENRPTPINHLALAYSDGRQFNPLDAEQALVYRALGEGLAEWASLKTAFTLGTDEEKAAAQRQVFVYRGSIKEEPRDFKKTHVDRVFKELKDVVDSINDEISGPLKFNTTSTVSNLLKTIGLHNYHAGYYFTYLAMEYLTSEGMTISEAINLLIADQPHTLQELRRPNRFVNSRLNG